MNGRFTSIAGHSAAANREYRTNFDMACSGFSRIAGVVAFVGSIAMLGYLTFG